MMITAHFTTPKFLKTFSPKTSEKPKESKPFNYDETVSQISQLIADCLEMLDTFELEREIAGSTVKVTFPLGKKSNPVIIYNGKKFSENYAPDSIATLLSLDNTTM